MPKKAGKAKEVLRDLGDGLVLRRAQADEAEAVATFNSLVHREPGVEQPDVGVEAWTRDLMNGDHPTTSASDFLVIENTASGEIISSMNLISQRWTYAGIEFPVGRPEAVGTAPEFRRRGLVRAQFDVLHRWSAERGEMVQVITGIPWYYRQFGYEMGLALGGGRSGYVSAIPRLKEGEEELYIFRAAEDADIPFMAEMYDQAIKRSLVACVYDTETWRYFLHKPSEKNFNRRSWNIIRTREGEPVGLVASATNLWGTASALTFYEVKEGVPWTAVAPGMLRFMWEHGRKIAERDKKEVESLYFNLGTEHPLYDVLHDALPKVRRPYAFFVRVPEIPAFLNHIKPALEQRISASPVAGYAGEVKLNFYRDGVKLALDKGKITSVEAWKPDHANDGDAAFPDLTFLQVLFGYRSLEELEYAFADCWVTNDTARAVVTSLFPKQNSLVWPLE